MPGLDLRPTFNNAYRELGGWSFALKDYIDEVHYPGLLVYFVLMCVYVYVCGDGGRV